MMIMVLLWIVGSYGTCIIALHVIYYLQCHNMDCQGWRGKMMHYVLITRNNQLQIEWYVRSLQFIAWLKGRNMALWIYDEGSTDDTLNIVSRIGKGCPKALHIWLSAADFQSFMAEHKEYLVVVRLTHEKRLSKLPLPF